MRIINGTTLEVDCTSCAVTFLTSRGEDGEPDETMCQDCWATLEDYRRTIAQERDRVWFETFLSFPFKQLEAPDNECEWCGSADHRVGDCRDREDWASHQDLMDAADQAAFYSPRWEEGA